MHDGLSYYRGWDAHLRTSAWNQNIFARHSTTFPFIFQFFIDQRRLESLEISAHSAASRNRAAPSTDVHRGTCMLPGAACVRCQGPVRCLSRRMNASYTVLTWRDMESARGIPLCRGQNGMIAAFNTPQIYLILVGIIISKKWKQKTATSSIEEPQPAILSGHIPLSFWTIEPTPFFRRTRIPLIHIFLTSGHDMFCKNAGLVYSKTIVPSCFFHLSVDTCHQNVSTCTECLQNGGPKLIKIVGAKKNWPWVWHMTNMGFPLVPSDEAMS